MGPVYYTQELDFARTLRQAPPAADRGHVPAAIVRRAAAPAPAHAHAQSTHPYQEPADPADPAAEHVARFESEMRHELGGGERPGVRSRFGHGLPAFKRTRALLEACNLPTLQMIAFDIAPQEVGGCFCPQ